MASLLRTDSPGDLERSQVPIRTSFATMMRETSECRHRPREFVRSTHEESVKDVSVDLSGMSPRVHTLSPLRGARDLARDPSPHSRGEGGRRPDEGCHPEPRRRRRISTYHRRDLRSFAPLRMTPQSRLCGDTAIIAAPCSSSGPAACRKPTATPKCRSRYSKI